MNISYYFKHKCSLKTESYHDAHFVITGGTEGVIMTTISATSEKQSWDHDYL